MFRQPAVRIGSSRFGFTLAEIMVVIILMLLLTGMTLPTALKLAAGDLIKDAATTVQIAVANARDRAVAQGSPVGIRLLPDRLQTDSINAGIDPAIVRSLILVQQANPLVDGSAAVMHGFAATAAAALNTFPTAGIWPSPVTTANQDTFPFGIVVLIGVDYERLKLLPRDPAIAGNRYGAIRFNKSGKYHAFTTTDTELASAEAAGRNPRLLLAEPLELPIPYSTGQLPPVDWSADVPYTTARYGVPYEILLGNIPVEDAEPITLPTGIVIDLGFLSSGPPPPPVVPDAAQFRLSQIPPDGFGNWDIMFAANGQVLGSAAASPLLSIWLREETAGVDAVNVGIYANPGNLTGSDITAFKKLVRQLSPGNHKIVSIYGRTGFVQASDPFFDGTPANILTYNGIPYFDQNRYYENAKAGIGAGL